MGKFIKNIVLFVVVGILGFPIVLFIWGSSTPQLMRPNLVYPKGWKGHLISRVEDISSFDDVDLVVLGSSHAYRGFDPRIFAQNGINMFNLGSSGQSPVNGKVLLKRYIDSLNPKLLIYVVPPGSFYMDGVESSLDIIANDDNDLYSLNMALEINHLKTYNTMVYGLVNDFLGLGQDYNEAKTKGGETYITGGYVEREEINDNVHQYEDIRWTLKEQQLEVFQENLSFLRTKGIEVILIQTPVSKSLASSYVEKVEYDELMSSYAEYYNFNDLIDLNDTLHFYDSHHLNKAGVKLFNNKLLELIDFKSRIQ